MANEPVTTVEITAAFVDPPAAGKKRGKIKDSTGVVYGALPAEFKNFVKGGSYRITYSENEYPAGSGTMWKTVKSVTKLQDPPPQAAKTNGSAGGSSWGEKSDKEAERIFVAGVLNAAIRAGSVALNTDDIVHAINDTRQAWRATFGAQAVQTPKVNPQRRDDMDEEIPF